jgi:hypothetical protein
LSDQQDELTEWKQHPFTQRFFNYLRLLRESAKEDWAREQFVGANLEEWALTNAKAIGAVGALRELGEIELEDIIQAEKESNEHAKQFRN